MTNLYQYKDVKKEIAHLEHQIRELERIRTTPRQSIITGMPTSPSHRHDKMDLDLIKMEELIEKYKTLVSDLYDTQLRIENDIEKLDAIERDLMRYRYFDGLKWEDVQKKLFISQKTCFRIHKKALDKLKDDTH